jgi:hypothetical protein
MTAPDVDPRYVELLTDLLSSTVECNGGEVYAGCTTDPCPLADRCVCRAQAVRIVTEVLPVALADERALVAAGMVEADELREAIETVCEFLMERGGWSEIDGDGDEGSIIVQHISALLTGARADADRLAEAIRGGQRVKQRLALAAHDAEVAGR